MLAHRTHSSGILSAVLAVAVMLVLDAVALGDDEPAGYAFPHFWPLDDAPGGLTVGRSHGRRSHSSSVCFGRVTGIPRE